MNKAVSGVFADGGSASRAINDLKALGFGGENLSELTREKAWLARLHKAHTVWPALEIPKGILIGALAGGIVGVLAQYVWGIAVSVPGLDWPLLWIATGAGAIVGVVAGLLEGLAAMVPLHRAKGALSMGLRADAVVIVQTDEGHVQQATEVFLQAGAWDVRRGSASMHEEFRTAEAVLPEPAEAPATRREPVQAPDGVTLP